MLAIVLLPTKGLCTKISGGTTLYLDVSAIWSNGTSFSAEFEQEGNSNTTTVPMSKVSNEDYVWQVTAPSGTWDYIRFHCLTTGASQGQQSCKIEWCGTYPLFYITAEDNGSIFSESEGGLWLNYLPIPNAFPSKVDTIVISDVCIDETKILRLNPFSNDEFVNFQWFDYRSGKWSRVLSRDARTTVNLPNIQNDTVYYYFKGIRLVNNQIPNPDFEQGNTGFNSDYTYATPSSGALFPEGIYTITEDIANVHGKPKGGYDHTYGDGTGHLMGVNGGPDPSKRVWFTTINNIKPNTDYVFSVWVMDWGGYTPAELQFSINNEVLGGIVSPSGGMYYWTQLYTYWNSGNATSAEITLLDLQVAGGGNDFAIDDIFFGEVEEYSCLHKVCLRDCSNPCPTPKDSTEYVTICDTLLPYPWHGRDLSAEGLYYDTLRNAQLCDSIRFTLQLSVITCEPPEPPIDSTTCVPDIIYAKWTNVLFCDNSADRYVGYQWYNNDILLEGEEKQYLYLPEGMSGTFSVKLTLTDGSHEWACAVDYAQIPRSADVPYDQTTKVRVCDTNGRVFFTGVWTDIPDIKASLPHGIYIVFLETNDVVQVSKWIL
jgi:hypothetical protein